MTTENEVIYKAQGNGASDNMVHVTRADRFTSFNLEDHPVPTGREEDWRFTPMRRFRHLFDVATFAAGDVPLNVSAPEGVLVTTAKRGDEAIGDALLVDKISRTDTYPYVDVRTDDVEMGHEATVSKVSEDQLFYLMSRGLDENEAMATIVRGFVEPIAKELPMEYALELNRLIELQMEGSVG